MSWKDNIRKAKFQGPPERYSEVSPSFHELKLAIASIDFLLGKIAKYLEEDNIQMVKAMLKNAQEEVDKIDAKVLAQEKYTGKTKFTSPKLGERIDSKEKYSGTKFQGPER